MTRSIWNKVVARLFDKKSQVREQSRRRLSLEWLEQRLAPATDFWTGGAGATNNWSNAANWSNGVPQQDDLLNFDARATNRTTYNDLPAGYRIGSITISASNYTLGGSPTGVAGNRITLGQAGIHVNSFDTNEKIALDIQLGTSGIGPTSFTFAVDRGADLTLSGHISGVANTTLLVAPTDGGPGILTLAADNTVANATLNGTTSNTGMDGKIDIRKGGILAITNSKALGSLVGQTTVEDLGQLQLGSTGLSVGEFLTINGRGVNSDGALLNTGTSNTWTGVISMDHDADIGANANTTLNVSGLVTDTGAGHSIQKDGKGTIIFSRHVDNLDPNHLGNTYRGQTIINDGILNIQDPLSLGFGAASTTPQQVSNPAAGVLVNYNNANGFAGTLQLQFGTLTPGDANGILQNPALPFNSVTNPYVGFQVFNDLITLNGPGFNGLGALSSATGVNGWDGDVILGGGTPNSGSASVGAATGSQLTISGVVKDGTQTGSLVKVLPGRVILNNKNTYTGTTSILNGALQIADSQGLGSPTGGTASVSASGTLELAVDQGLDGTTLRTHNRNLGFDSVNQSVASNVGSPLTASPVQEVYVTPGGTAAAPTGTFTLTFKGQTTTPLQFNDKASTIQAALNNLSTIGGVGGSATVVRTGPLIRITFGGTLAGKNQVLMTAAGANGATAVVTPVYGLTVSKNLSITGTGIGSSGAVRNISGINTYAGNIAMGGTTAGIGADNDVRLGHPLADSTYFTNDYSLNVTGVISGAFTTTLEKDGTGQLILASPNTYQGPTNVAKGWITVEDSGALGITNPNTPHSIVTTGGFPNFESGEQAVTGGIADTLQAAVTVQSGAAVHFKNLPASTGLNIAKNFIVSGLGIVHPYSMLNQEGALLNLGGVNSISGEVALVGNVGVGSQNLDPAFLTNTNTNNSQSQLTFTGPMSDFQGPTRTITSTVVAPSPFFANAAQNNNIIDTGFLTGGTVTLNWDFHQDPDRIQIYNGPVGTPGSTLLYDSNYVSSPTDGPITVAYPAGVSSKIEIIVNPGGATNSFSIWQYTARVSPNSPGIAGGITKLGNQTVILQGDGTYTGGNEVKEGILRVQNASALGQNTSGAFGGTESSTPTNTVVDAGARIEVGSNIPSNFGGVVAGSQIADENLTLNGQAQLLNVSGVGGLFQLSFNGVKTGPLAANVPAYVTPASTAANPTDSIQNALNNLSSIGGVGGSVTVTKVGNVFVVVFGGTLGNSPQPDLVAYNPFSGQTLATSPETDFGSVYVSVTNLASSLSAVTGDSVWKGGLTLGGNTTIDVGPNSRLSINGPINDSTNAAAAGSGLTKTGNGELVLEGADTYRGTTFIQQGILTAANGQALGASGSNEAVQTLTLTGDFYFTLGFKGQTTAPIHSNPNALDTITTDIQTALNNLSTVKGPGGTGFVTVTRGPQGNLFTITFSGADLLGQNQPQLVATVTSGTGTAVPRIVASGFGGTVVSAGAQLQLRGNLNIAAEALTLQGTGPGAGNFPGNIPVSWFSAGPTSINKGQTAGNLAVTGRVTGVAVDPTDDNVIYISTAGGGAWKTINGGKTWTPMFDGISAVQTIDVTGKPGDTFTLTFNGATTGPIPYNATAEQVQAALNALSSIQTADGTGYVSVSLTTQTVAGVSHNIYTVTFSGGSLADSAQPTITATPAGTAAVTVTSVPNGAGSPLALFTGAIAVNAAHPNVLYLATGEANNSGDSYYGTGVYRSSDSGRTWSLVVDSSSLPNPIYGQVISKIVVDAEDPTQSRFYIATSDLGANAPTLVAAAGVWRFDSTGGWFNLTSVPSALRAGTPSSPGPATPGPDDDYRYSFNQFNVDWSDLALVGPPGAQVLIASLGTPFDFNYLDDRSNAVFQNFNPTSSTPSWFVGSPDPAGAANKPNGIFPAGPFTGTPLPPPNNGLIRFAADTVPVYGVPGDPERIYYYETTIYAAVTYPIRGGGDFGTKEGSYEVLYKGSYADRTIPALSIVKYAINWAAVSTNLGPYQGTYPVNQGEYDNFVVLDPHNPNVLYVGGVVDYNNGGGVQGQIYASKDGGVTFKDVSVDGANKGPHSDQHAAALDNQGRLVVGNDGGVFRLDSAAPAVTNLWSDLNGNLNITTFNGVSQNPSDPNILIGSSQDNGTEIGTNGGGSWTFTDGGDGGQIAFDPINPNLAYHVLNGVLRKSTDGGNTWATILNVNGQYFPFVIDQVNSHRLLVADGFGFRLDETLDNGGTFQDIGGNLGKAGFFGNINAIALAQYQGGLPNGTFQFDPAFPLVKDQGASTYDKDTIYVTNGFQIAVTKDHGLSWALRDLPVSVNIESLTVDPRNRDTVYAVVGDPNGTGNGRVFKSTDAGQTWADISGTAGSGGLPDTPTQKLVVDPRTGTLYVANDNGVWDLPLGIANGTSTIWQRFGAGMPDVKVTTLELSLSLNLLTAGTYGRGAFQLYLGENQANSGALHVVSGASTWTGPVHFTGATTINVGGSQSLPSGAGAGLLNILGTISDANPGANFAFTKDGAGTLVLSGANNYGGVTNVVNGILLVNNPQALGAFDLTKSGVANQGGTIVSTGAALELESDLRGEPVQLGTGGPAADGIQPGLNNHNTGALRNISGNNTYTGPLTLASNATIGVDSSSTLTIGALASAPAQVGTIAGPFNLTKELTGTLVLASANSAFTGNTFVYQGAIRAQNSTALGVGVGGAAPTATVLDGAQMQIQGDAVTVAANLILSGTGIFGTGALLNTGGKNTWSGNITLTSLPGFSPSTTPAGSVSVGTQAQGDSLTLSGVLGEAAGEPSGLSKIGLGTVVLTNANTFSGSTDVLQGTLEIQNSNALGTRSTTGAVQRFTTLDDRGNASTGLVNVSFNGPNGAQNTSFAFGANAAAVQNALNTLLAAAGYTPAQLRVTVTRTTVSTTTNSQYPTASTGTAYLYTVTFTGTLASTTQEFVVQGVQGTLAAESVVGIGGIGALVNSGAELDLRSALNGAVSTPSGLELALNGAGVDGTGALHNRSGATNSTPNVWGGQVDLQSDSVVNVDAGSTLAFPGNGFGFGALLTKNGGGTLEVDGNFANQFTVNTVSSNDININLVGGILSGLGSVGGVFGNGGTVIHPGDNLTNTIGTLTSGLAGAPSSGVVSFSANDLLFVDLGSPGGAPGTANDLLMVNGPVSLGNGTASLNGLLTGSGHVPGNVYTIVETDYNALTNTADAISGVFHDLSSGNTPILEFGAYAATLAKIGNTQFNVEYFKDHIDVIQLDDSTSTSLSASPTTTVYGQSVTFTATVTYTGATQPTGSVSFYDNTSTLLGTVPVNPATGMAALSTTTLAVGNHSITAVYSSTNSPALPPSTSNPVAFTVTQDATTTTISSSPNPSSFGQNVTFTAKVTANAPGAGSPTGNVLFHDNTTNTDLGTGTLDNTGTATFSTGTLSVGSHYVVATYQADNNFSGSTSASGVTQTVIQKQPTSTSVSSSMPTSTVGQNVTFTATVTNAGTGTQPISGNVEFYDGSPIPANDLGAGTYIGNGQWTFSTAALSAGTHNITAVYQGDANYLQSQGSVTQQVNAVSGTHATKTTLSSSNLNPSVGQTVTFTATVSPNPAFSPLPTGTVTFYDGNAVLGTGTVNQSTGVATFNWVATGGTHVIKAVYGGDSNYAPSTSPTVTETVSNSTTTLKTSNPNPPLNDQSTVLTATVTGANPGPAPTGYMAFYSTYVANGTAYKTFIGYGTYQGGGVWTFNPAVQYSSSFWSPAGARYTITTHYYGDANYSASDSNGVVETVQGSSAPPSKSDTTISLTTSNPNPPLNDQSTVLTATVTPMVNQGAAPTGFMAFYSTYVANGTAYKTFIGYGTYQGGGVWTFNPATQYSSTFWSPVGATYTITAHYYGDANYNASDSNGVPEMVTAPARG